ncbi:hypothetical protein CAEBREN_09598 [Caenorhabditis brenneri]|uniref:ribonuclease H n=1 Tax=Caenorhabditis brenneri TaxID=135651 RepID=G0P495_CAEBE|nr:hypothetical protein CAEBREN_09598 [Caenorhabditis brenneri]
MREFIEEQLTRLYCDQNYSGNNREWYVEENERKKYHAFVFTDGSYRERPQKITGIGVFWGDDHPNNYCGLVHGDPSNNRAELCAAHHAIGQAFREDYRAVTIISDSKFVKNILEDPGRFDIKTHEKMKDLLVSIKIMRPFIKINIFIVKGHAGNYGNEEADRLARFVTWNQSKESMQTELEKTQKIQCSERAILKKERIRRHTMYQLAAIQHGYDLDPQQDVFGSMGAPIGYLSRASIRRFITANLPSNPESFMDSEGINQFAPPMERVPNDIFSNMGPPIGFDPFLKMERWVNPGGINPQQIEMWQYQSQHFSCTMGAEERRKKVENVQVLQVNSGGFVAGNDNRGQTNDRRTMLVKCQDPCCALRPMPQAPAPPIAPCAPKNPALNGYNPPMAMGPVSSNNVLKNSNVHNMNSPMRHPMRPPVATHVSPVLDQENQAPHTRPCAPGNPGLNGGSPPMGPVVSSSRPIQSNNVMRNSTNQPVQLASNLVGKPMVSSVNNQVMSAMLMEERRTMVENVQVRSLNSGPYMAAIGTRRQIDQSNMLQRPQTPVPPISPCAPRNQAANSYYPPMGPVVSSYRPIERNGDMRKSTNQPMKMASSLVGKPMVLPVNPVMSTIFMEERRTMVENVQMRPLNSGPSMAASGNRRQMEQPTMLQRPQTPVPPISPCALRNQAPNPLNSGTSMTGSGNRRQTMDRSTMLQGPKAPVPPLGSFVQRDPVSNGYSPPMGLVERHVLSTMSTLQQSRRVENVHMHQGPQMAPRTLVNTGYTDANTARPTMLVKCRRSCCSMKPMPQSPAPPIGPCAPTNPALNCNSPPMEPASNNNVLRDSDLNNMNAPMRYPMRPPASLNLSFVPDQKNQAPAGQRPPMRKRQRSRTFGLNSANSMMLNNRGPIGKSPVMSTMVVKEQSGPPAPMKDSLSSKNAVAAVPTPATPLKSISPVTNVTTSTPYSTENEAGPLLSTDDPLTDTAGQDSPSPPEIVITSVHKSPSKIFHGFSVPNFMIFQRVFELTCISFVNTKSPSEISVVELD